MKLGIIGSGQLGLMMILEGKKLGVEFSVIDTDLNGPASKIADYRFKYEDYREFVDSCDFVTYEFEHVDERTLNYASEQNKLRPGMFPVELKRDRSLEKQFLKMKGLPVGEFQIGETSIEALRAAKEYGNAVIKSVSGGYDGKGQYFVRDSKLPAAIPEGKYVVEEFVDFDFEASVIGSRSEDGTVVFHEPSFNLNRHGMLFYNIAPTRDYGMRDVVSKLLKELDYIGVIGVEFFVKGDKVLINEFAPRVHNSGHHTLVGSSLSQFEQHVRAVFNLPILQPVLYRPSGILNIVGKGIDSTTLDRALKVPETQVYWYGKSEIRRRRKLGHVNVTGENYNVVKKRIEELSEIIYGADPDDSFR